VDPIQPIVPGALPISGLPVQPPERISRERDRPSKDTRERRRREPPPEPDAHDEDEGEDGRPRIDVRA
jgi:hypothetical protein